MRSKTVEMIMSALFEKSDREAQHSQRVSELCEEIAVRMQFERDDVEQIRMAGLVHDIGKIGINEAILNKNAVLDETEWVSMKRHPESGWRILNTKVEFSEVAQFALCHHERFDGKGYPKGLKGEEIPIQARIIAVADAFDAMTSERSYRKPLSFDVAIQELRKCSGRQFDPKIVEIFIEIIS
jgi:HD-GYP domain-containing protein (c-di-GMP phosphodiesterase class II)